MHETCGSTTLCAVYQTAVVKVIQTATLQGSIIKKNRLEIDKNNGQAHTHRPTVCVLVCYFIYSQSQVFHYGVNSPARLYIFTFIFKAQANVLKC